MPTYRRRTWWGLAAAAALITAACNSSTGPQPRLSNPQQLNTDLQTVSNVFAAPAFQSFGALRTATGSPIGTSAPAGVLLGAAPVVAPRTTGELYASGPQRLQELRLAAATLGSGFGAVVIPPTARGKTYIWDVTTHAYIVGPDPGPSTGIRIILYALDPSGHVAEPPVAIGFVDLLDESSANTNTLHVIVRGGTPMAPGTTYVDYTINATVTGSPATAFSALANGFVSDGTRTLTFSATFSATNLNTTHPTAQIAVTWSLDNPAVSVALSVTIATADANNATLTIDLRITHGSETVRIAGTVTLVQSPQTLTADLTVYVNDQTFARITGTNAQIQLRHADGSALSPDELQAVANLFALPAHLTDAIEDVFHPAEHLMGA